MRLLCSLLALVSLTACANTRTLDINQPLPAAPPLSQYSQAGAVSVDITPPPGMPMGGYSVMANRGQGFRTRIKARVVYLNDGKGQAMALVQTDLTPPRCCCNMRWRRG